MTGGIRLVVKDFGFTAGGWRVDKHPRFMADITGDGLPDVVGLGENNIITSLAKGDGTYSPINVSLPAFSFAQGWRVDKHPRFLIDTTGDGKSDIVGFGDDGVWISASLGNGDFQSPMKVVDDFGFSAGGWRMDKHLRLMGDITGDGRADIVGFGESNVWVARAQSDGTYSHVFNGVNDFSFAQGWRVDKHPRFLADTTGDGLADIVGFGENGVWVSRSLGNGTFDEPRRLVDDFAFSAGDWRVDQHPRHMADLNGDHRADIVGFGSNHVWFSLAENGDTYAAKEMSVKNFGVEQGWQVAKHPRFLADTTGDGKADIVGFGEGGVWLSRNPGKGQFEEPKMVISDYGFAQGWRLDKHLRFVVDTNGNGRADIVGFGESGVSIFELS